MKPSQRSAPAACSYKLISFALALLLLLQSILLWNQLQDEATCEVEERFTVLDTPNGVRFSSPPRLLVANSPDAGRTAIYLVPTLFRDSDPEMWFIFARHFVSHACYAQSHGYSLVLDTTNYIKLPENMKHKDQATGSSEFIAESNWPYALRAALTSQERQKGEYDYDTVYIADIDIMFVNDFRQSMKDFIDNFELFTSGSDIDVMVAQPFPHTEYGEAIPAFALLVRNTANSRWMADEWIRLISGGCGQMTFGDQGYLHVALLKLIVRDREARGVPYARDSQGGGDDACEMVCNMPDIPGAELRKGSVQPQAPHAHERYAETLACFERRSAEMGLWRGHRTFAAHGPVAFSRLTGHYGGQATAVNRSISYLRFESGIGLNVNWDAQFSVEGNYRNMWDALSVHTKSELGAASYADTQPDFIHATTRCFGSVYMPTPTHLLHRMIASKRSVWRTSGTHFDGPPPPLSSTAPLPDGGAIDDDLADLIVPASRLQHAKPAWPLDGSQLAAIVVTAIDSTMGHTLGALLEAARRDSQSPHWDGPLEMERCTGHGVCPTIGDVVVTPTGPVHPGFFGFDGAKNVHSPYGMPMPFPNALLERPLSNLTREFARAPPGVVWHMTMLAQPAVRVARAWLADAAEQRAVGAHMQISEKIQRLLQFAQRPENVNVQVLSLMGCGKYGIEQERACCCQPAERFYHAKMVLRHYISFFGVYERWSFSMSLLEATLRFGVGAESWPDANSRWRASDERPRASLWHTHAWRKPPLNASADWRAGASMCGTLLSRAERDGAYDPHAQEFWPLLLADSAYALNRINKINAEDDALYEFALEEMSRRAEFFRVKIFR